MVEEEAGEEREQKRGLLGGRCGDGAGSMPEIEDGLLVQNSLASQTQPTPARIAFSITHGEGRVW